MSLDEFAGAILFSLKLDEFVLQLLQLLQGYLPFYSDMKKLIQKNFCRWY